MGLPEPIRPRWTDEALDQLDGRVDTLEDERQALSALPGRVIAVDGKVDRIDERTRHLGDAHQRVRDELRDMRKEFSADVRGLREEMRQGFATVNRDHTNAAAVLQQIKNPDRSRFERFKDTMAWLGPIIAAAIIALVGAYVALKTSAPTAGGAP